MVNLPHEPVIFCSRISLILLVCGSGLSAFQKSIKIAWQCLYSLKPRKNIDTVALQQRFVAFVISFEMDSKDVIAMFEEYLIYPDFMNDFMIQTESMLSKNKDRNEVLCENMITLFSVISTSFPQEEIESEMNMSPR